MALAPPDVPSLEAVCAPDERPALALLARLPACSLLSPNSWSREIKKRELVPRRQPLLQICVRVDPRHLRAITLSYLERLHTRLRTRTEPFPLRFGTSNARAACAFPRPSGRRAPRPPIWWLAGSLCVPPLPTWQEQVKGDAGRGPAAGRASRTSFSTFQFNPARPFAHVLTGCLWPPAPLGRCYTPTPQRTSVIPAAFDIYSLSCAQNRHAVQGGTIMCGARARARFGTRIAGRCVVGR